MATVLTGPPEDRGPQRTGWRGPGFEWGVLGGLGAAFALMSLIDIGLTFVPLELGSAQWEFATATAVMNNLPLALVGLGLVAVAGIGRSSPGQVRAARLVSAALAVLVLLLAVMFVRNLGAALVSVQDPVLKEGLKESIVRTSAQLVTYFAALAWIVIRTRGI